MASITITIPDQHVDRVVHALCVIAGVEDETPANAKQVLVDHIKNVVGRVERREQAPQIDTDGIAS